jgi:hypothetical protein
MTKEEVLLLREGDEIYYSHDYGEFKGIYSHPSFENGVLMLWARWESVRTKACMPFDRVYTKKSRSHLPDWL